MVTNDIAWRELRIAAPDGDDDEPEHARAGTRGLLAAVFVLAAVAAATALLRLFDANLAVAVLAYLTVVVVAAWFGFPPATVAVVASYLALNYWFTDPVGALQITKSEDVAPLLAFSITAIACARRAPRRETGPLLAVFIVGVVAGLLLAADADLVVASTTFTGVVVVTALLGWAPAATAVVASYVALNFWFTPPYESLEINKFEDLVPLITFAAVAAVSAGTVARVDWLRRRQAEIEQEAFDAQLANAISEGRAAFLASMTHNLRTPLATIKAVVSALLASPERRGGADASELLASAYDETDRLERLVTKVLELARIHAGAVEPRLEPTDVGELTRVAVRRLRHIATGHRLRLAVEDELVIVSVDPAMIELVLVITLENALKFAPPETEVLVRAEAGVDRRCEIRVVDHGPGIPEGERALVFEEFARLDPRGQGSGLGLAIARALVDAHGGEIWAEPTPGGGATIALSIPGVEPE